MTKPSTVITDAVHRIARQLEAKTGRRCGFPSDEDYARFHRIVEVVGLCRDHLGHDRFCEAYPAVRELAVRLAPLSFIVEPDRDWRHVVTGYRFMFKEAETAAVFREQAASVLTAHGVEPRPITN